MTRDERQLLSIQKWKKAGGRSVLVAFTGIGKTRIALKTIQLLTENNDNIKIIIVVPTAVLKKQWIEEISKFNFNSFFTIEVQILASAQKKSQYCDLLIIDEWHTSCGEKAINIYQNCKYKLFLGLTATYERLDKRHELLKELCPIHDVITMEEAVENGWVSKCKDFKVVLDVNLDEYENSNRAFLKYFAFFDFDFKLAIDCLSSKEKQRKLAYDKGCTQQEVTSNVYNWNKALQQRKKFIFNHPKKLEIAKKIIEARKDKKIITFNPSIDICNSYGFGYVLTTDKKKEQEEIISRFNQDKAAVLHTAKMCDAGVDIKGLSVAINIGLNSSQLTDTQRKGRVSRFEDNKDAEMFTIILKGTNEEKWFKKAKENKNCITLNETELLTYLETGELKKKEKKVKNIYNEDLRY